MLVCFSEVLVDSKLKNLFFSFNVNYSRCISNVYLDENSNTSLSCFFEIARLNVQIEKNA